MATNRDVQSARVTKKKLKDVQYVNKTQTQQKNQQYGLSNQIVFTIHGAQNGDGDTLTKL